MNKYQEALNNLIRSSCPSMLPCKECCFSKLCNLKKDCCDAKGWIDTLQELVDRATPVAIELRNDGFHCPKCGAKIQSRLFYTFYCNECGQAFEGGMKDVK